MKRFAIVLAICMLLPLNAFALQPMSEDTMGQVTGQAGVSIAIDDVKLFQHIEYLTYTDDDGTASAVYPVATDGVAGSVSISDLFMMVHINAITSLDANGLPVSPGRLRQGAYMTTGGVNDYDFGNFAPHVFMAKALTIDAGRLNVLSVGMSNNATIAAGGTPTEVDVAGVQIGLPTVEVYQTELSFDVTVNYAGAHNDGDSYGRITIGGNTLTVLDGVLEIAPH